MIEYRKGDMFAQDGEGKIFLHACNSQGVWGSGIAKTFKEKFPQAYFFYQGYCIKMTELGMQASLSGSCFITEHKGQMIACLFTSQYYGDKKSPPATILANTAKALDDLFERSQIKYKEIHSPKINSGLFNVPWTDTEGVIASALEGLPIKWVVWELDDKYNDKLTEKNDISI